MPVGGDDARTEPLDHRRQHRRARLLQLADDGVGVDDLGAPLAASAAETVDLPEPIPPVSPMTSTAADGTIAGRRARSLNCTATTTDRGR